MCIEFLLLNSHSNKLFGGNTQQSTIMFKKSILFLLAAICVFNIVAAKSFNRGKSGGHEADMYSVLPFKRCMQISNWLEFIHKTIDFPYNKYFDGLRDAPHQNFSWGKYGHRIFFHWGFNSQPWSPQIQEQVNKCRWSEQVTASFRAKLIAEQAKRNRYIMEKTATLFNLSLSGQERAYVNALASIVSDVHLLGDYTTENIAPLPNLQSVINDIKTSLFERMQGGEQAKKINKLIDNTTNKHPDSKQRAQAVLSILQKELPTFIRQGGHFKNSNDINLLDIITN